MVVSLKANKKRILAFVILAVIVVGACVFLKMGKEEEPVREYRGSTGEERLAFLQSFGWELDAEPAETREVMIPAEFNDVYTAYNVMQKAQNFDLKPFAGKICTQYKYKINNYPGETEVYATLLVYGELIIGGDVACAEVDGFMHGFAKDSARYGETAGESRESSSPESAASSEPVSSLPTDSSSGAAQTEASGLESGSEVSSTAASQAESAVESTAGEAISEDAFPTD